MAAIQPKTPSSFPVSSRGYPRAHLPAPRLYSPRLGKWAARARMRARHMCGPGTATGKRRGTSAQPCHPRPKHSDPSVRAAEAALPAAIISPRKVCNGSKCVTAVSVSRQTVCHGGLNVRRSCLGGSCVTAVTVTAAGVSRRRACCGGEVPGRAGGGECVTAASASRRLESHGGDCVRAASESGRRVHYSACQRPCRCWPVTTAV